MTIGYKYNSRKVVGFLVLRGMPVLIQEIPIYLVYLTLILTFIFVLLFVILYFTNISMSVM